MKDILDIIDLIDKSIKQDGPNTLTSGGIINDGYNSEVDKYRNIINNSKDWLVNYQSKLIEETDILKLKIKYTNASGYFIEIPKSKLANVPDYFIHKQSLVNASRFYTNKLKEFEKDLMQAESILSELEYDIFLDVREKILEKFDNIKQLSAKSGFIDFGVGLAQLAYNNNYSRPKLTKKYDLIVKNGRHPIIEEIEKNFISNSLSLTKNDFVHIITGPNMGGKSTFLRQNALIVLMAHIGSFIPAEKSEIGLVDKIFSRVGATDNLYLGQSTFMVEMQEVANILNNSSSKSFVIIDEVGRGTSTFDGMSLAWSILKQNHDKIKAKTLFATHYHELIDEAKKLKGVSNYSVAVGENEENLVFLRKIIAGGMKKSYGIVVAKLAGIGNEVIEEAKRMLKKLEKQEKQLILDIDNDIQKKHKNINLGFNKKTLIEEKLEKLDINSLTPIEALNFLYELKKSQK